ncbi:hypothetical protein PPTG_24126 [Phytophthora nicotianae INRA-310]|uniref:Fe2OG dioxygenase domain-containing protein n=1 Tax=Phytophthora nicotianae (strain INRA-310) TaxID=761204 RepID=W2PLZ2_PHYN3|nr:hypothetical protein PPTG_24126 [Phytophthora nicotianae INRA-310]ETN01050.1 hypothetical protein PPTG_24126 [Phytophthora nicotianae INRA-310]
MDVRQVPMVDVAALIAFPNDVEVDAALRAKDGDPRKIVEEIGAAANEWGFFYIANHGLSEQEMAKFQKAMRSFFDLPRTSSWISEEALPGFHNEMTTYFNKMEYIARRLLKVFAVALGEEPTFFDQFFHDENSSHMRLNHYPATEDPEKTMGVYHHTDAGALTILLQDDDVASLQAFHRPSQTWANLHNQHRRHGAAPFFYNPSYKAQVEPIVMKPGDVANYRQLSWGEFRLRRYQGNVTDKGKEIQIGDFKVRGPIDVANS